MYPEPYTERSTRTPLLLIRSLPFSVNFALVELASYPANDEVTKLRSNNEQESHTAEVSGQGAYMVSYKLTSSYNVGVA